MRLTTLISKTKRQVPKDIEDIGTTLLIRGGYVEKLMAGVYAYLPLGWRVLKKIEAIIREEMEAIGGQELFLPALHPKEPWEASGRWQELDGVLYKLKDSSGKDLALSFTHEEIMAIIAKQYLNSYRDLPKAVFQFQTKFRDEPRPKSGLLRGREFIMKDLYSFHANEADLSSYYEKIKRSYTKIFQRCGLTSKITEAGGGTFTKDFSHEFQVLSDVGEDKIIYCQKCDFSQNIEIAKVKANDKCPKCGQILFESRGIEVGNIFKLGTKYAEVFNLQYSDQAGKEQLILMASYGIGLGRLMGTIAEIHFDKQGLIWPKSVAPYVVHLIDLGDKEAAKLYEKLCEQKIEVLFDDRDVSAGEKFVDADLLGLPLQVIMSQQTAQKQSVEIRGRREKEARLIPLSDLMDYLHKEMAMVGDK